MTPKHIAVARDMKSSFQYIVVVMASSNYYLHRPHKEWPTLVTTTTAIKMDVRVKNLGGYNVAIYH